MQKEDVLQEFKDAKAILNGHFVLTSGLHSDTYLQCARVLMEADRADRLCRALADKLLNELPETEHIDMVVAPAMGGVVVGYEMGRQLKKPAIFCERVDSTFALRRGFEISEGAKILIVEDVVTTGKSSLEAAECIRQHGGIPIAIASLIDRRDGDKVDVGLPIKSLLKLTIPAYKANELPEALQAIPPVKPGSRWLKG